MRVKVGHALTRFSPAYVVVDRDDEVVHLQGNAGRYLELAPGGASFNLYAMLRKGLARRVRTAVRAAQSSGAPVRSEHVHVETSNGRETIDIEVTPLLADGTEWLVVIFTPASRSTRPASAGRLAKWQGYASQVQTMQNEVDGLRMSLRTAATLQERTNAELQTANESVQSAYEELQSINEELEVSREELQSSNEELLKINDALVSRSAQLSAFNRELKILLSSASIPIVVVDTELKIRHFTEAAERTLQLIPTDIGRPLADLRLRLSCPDLDAWLREVIDTGVIKRFEVQDQAGSRYSVRLRPYRDEQYQIDGAAIVTLDMG